MWAFIPASANCSGWIPGCPRSSKSGRQQAGGRVPHGGRVDGPQVAAGEQGVEGGHGRRVLEVPVRQAVADQLGDGQVHPVEDGDAVRGGEQVPQGPHPVDGLVDRQGVTDRHGGRVLSRRTGRIVR